jgi:N-acetylmuramoyl-L-alanine amidase
MMAGAKYACRLLGVALVGLPLAVPDAARAAPPTRAPGDFPVASDVRLGGDQTQTRFVVDFDRKIDMRAFTLANPDRVVIDIPEVTFQLSPRSGEAGRGLIKTFRYGLVMRGGSRIVIDLARPARIEKAFVLDAENNQPARLVLDLSAVDRDTFMRTIALENRVPATTSRTAAPAPDAKDKNDARPLIVIDPGHGGIDDGTKASNGVTEKAIVLEFALLLRDKLERSGSYRVAMTRADDVYVPLGDRVQFARSRQAALFISIHADALRRGEGDAQGATVYTVSENASDSEAARLADAENRADVIAGVDLSRAPDDVADILIDLAQRETKTFSAQFARTLVDEMRNATRMNRQPLRSAGFVVLKAPDVPSVLIELGFVSNRQDLKLLTSNPWRDKAADSILQAINSFFSKRLAGQRRARPD